ncbi:MAG: Tfp pilus assembly protein FimT/FimU [Gemmatimonadaceae bacterium]
MTPRRHQPPHATHPHPHTHTRAGLTVLEVVAVLAVLSIVAGIALPLANRAADRIAVQSAITAVASACALARSIAIMRGTYATIRLASAPARVLVTSGTDTLLARRLDGDGRPITLSATRTTVTYSPIGLGYGAANSQVIARRGSAADTLWTSRLGRVRH